MERNFTNENFERFLRQNADSLKMRPTDKVWKEISAHLTRSRRRFTIILSVLLLITSGLAYEWLTPKVIKHNVANSNQIFQNTASNKESINTAINSNRSNSISNISSVHKSKQSYSAFFQKQLAALKPEVVNHISEQSTSKEFVAEPVDSYPTDETNKSEAALHSTNQNVTPLSIESVVNSFKGQQKKKINWQIYFTPTVSYRKLSENKSFSNTSFSSLSTLPQFNNINSVVTHKPDFGFEVGLTGKYPLSANLKLRAGLQFNVNRYDIKVFNAPNQLATIRLNSRYSTPDSTNAITTYSNLSGYHTDWLQNFYFQISAPVGLEFKLRGDDKMQFGIATSLQPTYLLGDRIYLISTDYKNYAQVPWLVRRWNINSSVETFVSYSTGHLKWQVGPQFRYQLLSSFIDKYPVKENLYNFGLKVGISLNQ